jgi:hypothetical protein
VLVAAGAGAAAAPQRDRLPPGKPTVSGPAETSDPRPVFHLSARDNRTPLGQIRFRCGIDTLLLQPCARTYRPLSALAFGLHVLRVRALDLAGNASQLKMAPFSVFGRWDAARDFLLAPRRGENPAPDQYGNTAWFYLYSSEPLHDPAQYQPLPQDHLDGPNEWWISGLRADGSVMPPLVGANAAEKLMVFHPDRGFAVLGWRSPYAGPVTVSLQLRFVDPVLQASSDGIVWSLDRGNATLQSQLLTPGNEARAGMTFDINTGETLFLVIDAHTNANSDLTVGQFTVETTHG